MTKDIKNDDVDVNAKLSPEELEALASDDDADALDAVLADGEADETVEGEDAAEVVEEVENTEAETVEDTPQQTQEFTPRMPVESVEDYDKKMNEINVKRDELLSKLDEGEIELKDFVKEDRTLSAQETELKLNLRDAENAAKYNKVLDEKDIEVGKAVWQTQIDSFFANASNKIYVDQPELNTELDKAVKYLANDQDNATRKGEWFLSEANALVRARFPSKFASTAVTEPAAKVVNTDQSRKPNLSNIPKTLASLPAAEISETGNVEFAYLEKLEGVQLEQELAKISKDPAKEARYLRA